MTVKKIANKKPLIIGICLALALIIIVSIILLITQNKPLDDSYFVSDNTKYVLTLGENDVSMNDEKYNPIKTHLVYRYSGEDITDLKAYYQYQDKEAAKAAYDYFKSNTEDGTFKDITINGNYVILTAIDSEYDNLTASDVKGQIEYITKSSENTNTDTSQQDTTEQNEVE